MTETIQLGDITIAMTRKDIKNVHLSVHPPSGSVTLVAPLATRPEVARAYAPCVREVVRCFTFALFLRWAG